MILGVREIILRTIAQHGWIAKLQTVNLLTRVDSLGFGVPNNSLANSCSSRVRS